VVINLARYSFWVGEVEDCLFAFELNLFFIFDRDVR
jgi:hypothetical protein